MREDAPFALHDDDERERRRRMLHLPRMRPLTDYVEMLRHSLGERYEIPYFDPCDGGIGAKALFLLEAPGPKAVRSGFISRNNPDRTANNMLTLLATAGLARGETLLWNIVPWYRRDTLGVPQITLVDIDQAVTYLRSLFELLPHLKVVALLGKNAQRAASEIVKITSMPLVMAPHPSPQNFNTRPQMREEALLHFKDVVRIVRSQTDH